MAFRSDRRRQERAERSPGAEGCIGLAVLCMAAALIGRDTWRYGTVAMILGVLLFMMGLYGNRHYLRERIVNRGALRRGQGGPPAQPRLRRARRRSRDTGVDFPACQSFPRYEPPPFSRGGPRGRWRLAATARSTPA